MDRRTVLAGLVAAAVVACGAPARDMLGEAMKDAGEAMEGAGRAGHGGRGGSALTDAGQALQDAGAALVDDAGELDAGRAVAQPAESTVLEGTCSTLSGRRYTNGSEASGAATYYAKVPVGDRDALELVGASLVLCDWTVIGEPPLAACPENTVCDALGTFPWPSGECSVVSSFEVRDGAVWAPCGSRTETSTAGRTTQWGGRWGSVSLVVPAS